MAVVAAALGVDDVAAEPDQIAVEAGEVERDGRDLEAAGHALFEQAEVRVGGTRCRGGREEHAGGERAAGQEAQADHRAFLRAVDVRNPDPCIVPVQGVSWVTGGHLFTDP